MTIKTFTMNPFMVNMHLVYNNEGDCIIIDASNQNERENKLVDDFIQENKLKPALVLLTHGHFDHLTGLKHLKEKYKLMIYLHADDHSLYNQSMETAQWFNFPMNECPPVDNSMNDNELITYGGLTLKVLHTPGHSQGGCCFYNPENKISFTGDTLFNQSIGRTDLPGGDYNQLMHSIHTKLLTLPLETKVFCGHGESTTIDYETKHNPYLQQN